MSLPETSPPVERYLDRVRDSLRGMPGPEVEDILLELRGHIAERSESNAGVEATLRSLGDPAELARQYRTESVTTRAECSRSPIIMLHSLMLLRRENPAGWIILALSALGYAWALALAAAAVEKILSPHDVGLWARAGGVSLPRLMVDGAGPVGTHEMLGWWFVPFGLAVGALLLFVTGRFARWWIRRSRVARADREI